ncbi:MAG: transposase [Thermoleophilia bacterium]|nr:transposase [Thermoleophilia bacterium]
MGEGTVGKAEPCMPVVTADPELVERANRRRFSAAYKLAILEEAGAATKPGEVGALLRREGLYSSHLTKWRRQREEGALEALSRARGRKSADPLEKENVELRRRLVRTEAELEKARRVIEVQGNVSALLGELLGPRGAEPDKSNE